MNKSIITLVFIITTLCSQNLEKMEYVGFIKPSDGFLSFADAIIENLFKNQFSSTEDNCKISDKDIKTKEKIVFYDYRLNESTSIDDEYDLMDFKSEKTTSIEKSNDLSDSSLFNEMSIDIYNEKTGEAKINFASNILDESMDDLINHFRNLTLDDGCYDIILKDDFEGNNQSTTQKFVDIVPYLAEYKAKYGEQYEGPTIHKGYSHTIISEDEVFAIIDAQAKIKKDLILNGRKIKRNINGNDTIQNLKTKEICYKRSKSENKCNKLYDGEDNNITEHYVDEDFIYIDDEKNVALGIIDEE